MTTRLVGFEAAAMRYANSLSDEDLQTLLSDRVERFCDHDYDVRAQDLRELAAAALVTARRLA